MAIVVEKGKEGKLKLSQRSFVAHITLSMETENNIIVSIVSLKERKRKQDENVMIVICTFVTMEKMTTASLTTIRSMLSKKLKRMNNRHHVSTINSFTYF